MTTSIYFWVLILILVSGSVGIYIYQKIIFRLKSQHYSTWQSIGSPTFIFNNSIRNQRLFLTFLKEKSYVNLNDSVLNKLAVFMNYFINIYLIVFAISFVVFIVAIQSGV